jgi:hypothetical protein
MEYFVVGLLLLQSAELRFIPDRSNIILDVVKTTLQFSANILRFNVFPCSLEYMHASS